VSENPNGLISRVAWSHNSRYIVAGIDGLSSGIFTPQVYVWNSETGKLLYTKSGIATSISVSPDNRFFAHADGNTVKIRSLQNGAIHTTLPAVVNNQVIAIAWSPDGTRLAYSGGSTQAVLNDGYVNVRVLATGKTLNYTQQKMAVTHIAWSPDSSRIASVSLDQVVNVWQAR
jgi:WD40 repeat protein